MLLDSLFPVPMCDDQTLVIRGSILDTVDGMGLYTEDLLPQTPPGRCRRLIDYSVSNPTTKMHDYGDTAGMMKALDRTIVSSVRNPHSPTIFHLPMLVVEEGKPYQPARFPEGMRHETATKLLSLRYFCEGNADFDLWGVKLGTLFPGIRK